MVYQKKGGFFYLFKLHTKKTIPEHVMSNPPALSAAQFEELKELICDLNKRKALEESEEEDKFNELNKLVASSSDSVINLLRSDSASAFQQISAENRKIAERNRLLEEKLNAFAERTDGCERVVMLVVEVGKRKVVFSGVFFVCFL